MKNGQSAGLHVHVFIYKVIFTYNINRERNSPSLESSYNCNMKLGSGEDC